MEIPIENSAFLNPHRIRQASAGRFMATSTAFNASGAAKPAARAAACAAAR
jgi:hypothetical protein